MGSLNSLILGSSTTSHSSTLGSSAKSNAIDSCRVQSARIGKSGFGWYTAIPQKHNFTVSQNSRQHAQNKSTRGRLPTLQSWIRWNAPTFKTLWSLITVFLMRRRSKISSNLFKRPLRITTPSSSETQKLSYRQTCSADSTSLSSLPVLSLAPKNVLNTETKLSLPLATTEKARWLLGSIKEHLMQEPLWLRTPEGCQFARSEPRPLRLCSSNSFV